MRGIIHVNSRAHITQGVKGHRWKGTYHNMCNIIKSWENVLLSKRQRQHTLHKTTRLNPDMYGAYKSPAAAHTLFPQFSELAQDTWINFAQGLGIIALCNPNICTILPSFESHYFWTDFIIRTYPVWAVKSVGLLKHKLVSPKAKKRWTHPQSSYHWGPFLHLIWCS